MTPLNISVSKLTSFDDYMHGRWNQEDDTKLVAYLTGAAEKTYEQSAGDAVHKLIETGPSVLPNDGKGFEVEGFHLSNQVIDTCNQYYYSLPQPVLFEQWLTPKRIIIDGYEVSVRARIDVITPESIRDIKTTESSFDYDRYADSYQWKMYLWLTESYGIDTFHYDVFQWRKGGKELRSNTITLHRYPTLETDCMRLLTDFVEYLKSKDLIKYCLPKSVPA